MGRKTWESIPEARRPLKDRITAVITSNMEYELPEGVLQFESLEEALTAISTSNKIDKVFIAGGGQLYSEAILHPNLENIYLTRIEEDYECDVFFPEQIPEEFEILSTSEIMESDGLEYYMVVLGQIEEEAEDELEVSQS